MEVRIWNLEASIRNWMLEAGNELVSINNYKNRLSNIGYITYVYILISLFNSLLRLKRGKN